MTVKTNLLSRVLSISAALLLGSQVFLSANPDGRQLVETAYETCDPNGKLEEVNSIRMTGSQNITAAGISLSLDILINKPNHFLVVAEMGGMKVRQGYNGEDAWMDQPGMGIVDMPVEMLDSMLESMTIDKASKLDELYSSFTWIRKDTTHAGPADVVELVNKKGSKSLVYIDETTHLIMKTESSLPSPMGEMTIIAEIMGYENFNDMLFPTETRSSLPTGNIIVRFDNYEFDVEVPADTFSRPQS